MKEGHEVLVASIWLASQSELKITHFSDGGQTAGQYKTTEKAGKWQLCPQIHFQQMLCLPVKIVTFVLGQEFEGISKLESFSEASTRDPNCCCSWIIKDSVCTLHTNGLINATFFYKKTFIIIIANHNCLTMSVVQPFFIISLSKGVVSFLFWKCEIAVHCSTLTAVKAPGICRIN